MKCEIITAMIAAGGVLGSAAAGAADITYTLDTLGSSYVGSYVNGTITTDGATGFLIAADIVAFDLTVTTGPSGTGTLLFELSSSAPGASVTGGGPASGLSASPTTLIATGSDTNVTSLDFTEGALGVSFSFAANPPGNPNQAGVYWSGPGVSDGFDYLPDGTIGSATAVPEPSSVALVGIGLACAFGATRLRARSRPLAGAIA